MPDKENAINLGTGETENIFDEYKQRIKEALVPDAPMSYEIFLISSL